MPDVKLNDLIGKAYRTAAYDIFQHGHTHYTFYGGRGSLKSSFASLIVPLLLVANKQVNALVLRKVSNTLRDSVFAQYQWALAELGIADYWTARLSPMELTYIPTGQKILFRGCDDPMKIKSITVPKGYIAITHFEELDQFAGRAEIRNVLQSTMRGGETFWNLETFNPPISRDNWANRDILADRPDRLLTQTSYLEAPPEWLGQQFLDEADWLRQTDEKVYRHEYLGEPVGTGGNVFENLEIRDILDAELNAFERTYVGCDYGYFPDPFAAVWCKYDAARRSLYVYDEIYAIKKTNEETAEMLKAHGVDRNQRVICDSAEPKSIADYRKYGLNAVGVQKGPGSIDRRMRWAQGLSKIVIDSKRCPNTARELLEYEYERTKDGEIVSGYPDINNHCVTGDTLVWTDKGKKTIQSLVGKRGKLFASDGESVQAGDFYNARLTQQSAPVYELTLANGMRVRLTADHPVLTKRGWVEVKDLRADDEVAHIGGAKSGEYCNLFKRWRHRLFGRVKIPER